MTLRHAALILSFILTTMADQDVPTVFPMETISCVYKTHKRPLYTTGPAKSDERRRVLRNKM